MNQLNIHARFAGVCDWQGDAVALQCDDGKALSYGDLRALAARFAAQLRHLGITPGERVMVQAEKSVGVVALYLACQQTGAIFVPLNTAYTPAELAYFAEDARPLLFVHDGAGARLAPHSLALGADENEGLWRAAMARSPDFAAAPSGSDDIAAICYTSGTTGRSKGAMISHGNLVSNAATLIDLWRFDADDTLLHILPIFHVHGLFVALHCALLSGARMMFERGFAIDRAIALLPRATVMMGVPTHYTRLLAHPAFGREATANIRLFLSGSAPLLAETHRRFEARTGLRILERYGMTEAGMITSNPYEGERVAGTVGFPLPGVDARVRDENGETVAPGEVGVLEIRGPNVFRGYWEMPAKTAETFTRDGWMITGDLVTMDATGRVTIVGRAKDLIITGGYNVYPSEIEALIDDLPGVLESAVIGVPDADFGERIVAVVVPDGSRQLDSAELESAFADRLARFKHPRRIEFAQHLPRNAMGKVQKAQLRELYSA